MKNIITLIVSIFITTNVSSQIGFTKSKLIQEHKDYRMDISDNGTDYITYVNEYENYNSDVTCYLTKKEDNEEQLCYRVLMIEPSSETNNWIKHFNENNFVRLDGMIWKDYETSIVYKVTVDEGFCVVVKYYDNKL